MKLFGKSEARHPGAIDAPPISSGDPDAFELMRAWIVNGGQLKLSIVPRLEEPDTWGLLLVDIARHVARMFEHEGVCSESEAMERIRKLWNAEIANPTDLGVTERPQ